MLGKKEMPKEENRLKLANELKEETHKKAKETVIQCINEASRNGKFLIFVMSDRIDDIIVEELKNSGYVVRRSSLTGDYRISWGNISY